MSNVTALPIVPWPHRVAAAPGTGIHWDRRTPVRVAAGADVGEPILRWLGEELVAAGWPPPQTTTADRANLVLRIDPACAPDVPEPEGVDPRSAPADERHRILVADARVQVSGASEEGLFRALATLMTTLDATAGVLPALDLRDGPRWRWRGLSLDVVRHPFGQAEVFAVVDLLARYKFNLLHLHLTDSQGWRLKSAAWPGLSDPAHGTVAPFSAAELAQICAYAASRHVTVLPEVDLPGHAAVARLAYPDLGPVPPHPTLGHIGPDAAETPRFLADVYEEFAAHSAGPFLHIGADEPFGMEEGSYLDFVRLAAPIARRTGKRLVAWQEAIRAGALGPDDVMQYWIGPRNTFDADQLKGQVPAPFHPLVDDAAAMFAKAPADVAIAIAEGVPVLLSSNDMLYLDRPYADPVADPAGEERRGRLGLAAYPPRTLAEMYDWAADELPELTGARLAGIEAGMWGETITDFDDLAFLLLPRLAGVAEHAWSWQRPDFGMHHARLGAHRPSWERSGWGAAYWPADTTQGPSPEESHR